MVNTCKKHGPLMEAQDYAGTIEDLEQVADGLEVEVEFSALLPEDADTLTKAKAHIRDAMKLLKPLAEGPAKEEELSETALGHCLPSADRLNHSDGLISVGWKT